MERTCPGNSRGWRHRASGSQAAQRRLEGWHRSRLQHHVVLLNGEMRSFVEGAISEICGFRNWPLWALSVRSNHVHVVLSASEYNPEVVRDQLKAKATRKLRFGDSVWNNRPFWSAKGDIEFLDTEAELEQCVVCVSVA